MKRILFIGAHRPGRSPSQRFRFEQYFEFLSHSGFECHLSYIISEQADHFFYKRGHYLGKAGVALGATFKRLGDVFRARTYDVVFVQREAFMIGTTFFEQLLKLSCGKMVFDFDDSIWVHDISEINRNLAFLKRPSKTSKIIAMSNWVIAGNQYLADYALQFNKNVSIIPTTIDTHNYSPSSIPKKENNVNIGWSGSFSTIKHFSLVLPALNEIKKKFGDKVQFEVIGDANFKNAALGIVGKEWKEATEVEDLRRFDIGIMPLPDDEWSKGKCGLKGLQYMALEIPSVMSPVGVNTQIIADGQNGLLANTQDEWIEKLSLLINHKELRSSLGRAGRKTVVEKYSVESQQANYVNVLERILGS